MRFKPFDNDPSRMRTVLLLIAELYRIEKWAREHGLAGEDLRLLRQQGARPVLDKLEAYLLEIREQLLPKSEAGQAVHYLLKNWTTLTRYCDNSDLSIDNNHTERSLRGWAVGRANWTFFGSRGGTTAAVLRSFVASCELLKIDPFAWFHDVLARIADHPLTRLDSTVLPPRPPVVFTGRLRDSCVFDMPPVSTSHPCLPSGVHRMDTDSRPSRFPFHIPPESDSRISRNRHSSFPERLFTCAGFRTLAICSDSASRVTVRF